MNTDEKTLGTPDGAGELITGLITEPWGQVSPSVYETGRLVALASGLAGHAHRVDYLIRAQRPDGGWGAPDRGYALVPTLSAADALLASVPGGDRAVVDAAVRAGRTVSDWLCGPDALKAADLPDLPAIELIVPSLVSSINRRLSGLDEPALAGLRDGVRPRPPAGMTDHLLGAVRDLLATGGAPPQKLLHALEVGDEAVRGHPAVRPEETGTVGASPAATAAWLGGDPAGDPRAHGFLETAVRRYSGPVPCGLPITVFERGWVLGWLVRAGVPVDPPGELVLSLKQALGPEGAAAAAGLPADADTTAGALYALALAGAPRPPDPLWRFETNTHFCTWPGEDGVSVSTNAHVLEAFGEYVRADPHRSTTRHATTIAKLSAWLREAQRADGAWQDRWHVSPYYATACAALALHHFGGPAAAAAVDRAVRWVLATQRADGSWGHWAGTAEETAYAVQILLLTRGGAATPLDGACLRASAGGCSHLLRYPAGPDDPPLWHDKDLYLPIAIVRAAVLAALHLGRRYGVEPNIQ